MRDTSSAANHRRSDRAYRTDGLESDQPVVTGFSAEDGTWFEALSSPPRDTPLIALVPVPRPRPDDATAG